MLAQPLDVSLEIFVRRRQGESLTSSEDEVTVVAKLSDPKDFELFGQSDLKHRHGQEFLQQGEGAHTHTHTHTHTHISGRTKRTRPTLINACSQRSVLHAPLTSEIATTDFIRLGNRPRGEMF